MATQGYARRMIVGLVADALSRPILIGLSAQRVVVIQTVFAAVVLAIHVGLNYLLVSYYHLGINGAAWVYLPVLPDVSDYSHL